LKFTRRKSFEKRGVSVSISNDWAPWNWFKKGVPALTLARKALYHSAVKQMMNCCFLLFIEKEALYLVLRK
jgi:hypothetical protein